MPQNPLALARSGSLAVVDQALFAGTNFLVNILLARWSSASEYGAFALAQSVFFLLAALHSNILIEPMMVLGAGKYASVSNKYFGSVLYFHAAITLPVSVLLGAAAMGIWALQPSGSLGKAIAGVAVATPLILLLWLSRRALYVRAHYERAVAGGMMYLLLSLAAVYGLNRVGLISSLTALASLGGSGLLVACWFLTNLKPELRPRVAQPLIHPVLADHWQFGRWLLAASMISWLFDNAVLALMAGSVGLQAAGVFRAYQYLMMPLAHGLVALGAVVVPLASERYTRLGLRSLRRINTTFTLLSIAISVAYVSLLYVFRSQIVREVLGAQYLPHVDLLRIWILAPIIAAIAQGTQIVVRVAQRTSLVLYSNVVGVGFAIAGCLILVPRLGLAGAVWAVILSIAARIIALLALYRGIARPAGWAGSP